MTVESTINKMAPQQMGTLTEYPFTFPVLLEDPTEEVAKASIMATVVKGDGNSLELVYGSSDSNGYNVTLNSTGNGGTVVVNDNRTSGDYITIYRRYGLKQEADFQDFNAAPADTTEQCFDKGIMIAQQQQEELNRSIKVPITSAVTNLSLPIPIAGRTLKWNDEETGLVNSDVSIDDIDSSVEIAIQNANISTEQAAIATEKATSATESANKAEERAEKAKEYMELSGGKGMPTDICRRLNIEYDTTNRKVKLKWKDPNDTINSLGQVMSSWAGTKITYKENSYPDNYDDGVMTLDSKVRNQYQNQEFVYDVPENITDITTLKFRAFPYSVNDVYNKDSRNFFDRSIVYEFLYDSTNSNVNGSIKYPQGSLNEYFKPMKMDYSNNVFDYGSWGDSFIMDLAKPCMLYNQNAKDKDENSLCGQIMEMLNPNDYSKTVEGLASHVADDIVNANAMVQWKSFWIKIIEYERKKYHIYIANRQIDENYKCYMHYNKNGEFQEFYYRAMYDGCLISNIIRSISGKAPCVNLAGNTQIANAKANGDGYNVDEARFILATQILLMLLGKSTDTQAVFGNGRNSGGSSNNYNQLASGQLNNKGQFFGDNSNGCVKVFHSENLWGNVWKIMQGIIQKSGKLYLKLTPNTNDGSIATDYNETGEGYIDTEITLSGTSAGYISGVELVGEFVFFRLLQAVLARPMYLTVFGGPPM